MNPEAERRIIEDWRESLPDVIAGIDRRAYPPGWALGDRLEPETIAIATIVDECARAYRTTLRVLRGEDRRPTMSRARQLSAYLCRKHRPDFSVSQLARYLDKHGKSVDGMIERAEQLLETDPEFREKVERVEKSIGASA